MQRCALAVIAVLACAALTASCGDNLYPDGAPLPAASRVNLVAHPDDDLLFMQPDLWTALHRGDGVVTVVVTAGQARNDLPYAEGRERGLQYAYQVAAEATGWDCGTIAIADHLAEHCAATGTKGPVSLVYLGLPDGGPPGDFPGSLLSLWSGEVDHVETVARRPQRYTEPDLIDVLAEVIRQARPAQVYTLDVVATHGLDHSDHMLVGAAATRAVAAAHSPAPIVSFRGYNVTSEPINKPDVLYDAVSIMMRGYGACTEKCGTCGQHVCSGISEYHEDLLRRRYATSLRGTDQPMRLQLAAIPDQCLATQGSAVVLAPCGTAPVWQLRGDRLALGDACLTARADGQVEMAPCDGAAAQWWRLHDEGALVGGVASPHVDDMLLQHTLCLGAVGDAVQGLACGGDVAPSWQGLPVWRATALSAGTLAVTIADVSGDGRADLCELRGTGVFCGAGDGTGGFAPLVQADAGGSPWQGTALVAGRDAGGAVACTTQGTELRCTPLLSGARTAWAHTFTAPIAPASLALIDVNGDGSLDVCVQHDTLQCFDPHGESVFAPAGAPGLQLVDVDHDGRLDRCGVAGGQLQCALAGDLPWRDASIVWSYARGGAWEPLTSAAPAAPAVWADLDGDAVFDACVVASGVRCAFGNRFGLGPSFAVPTPIAAVRGLWLADLAGSGSHHVCVADEATVWCSTPAAR